MAAKTRRAYFAALPEAEMASIRTAPEAAPLCAALVAGATHLPGHDFVNAALREELFPRVHDRHTVAAEMTSYHLLTSDCPELPEVTGAGLTHRAINIELGGCFADEWLLRFGDGGFVGWIAEALGIDPVGAPPLGSVR